MLVLRVIGNASLTLSHSQLFGMINCDDESLQMSLLVEAYPKNSSQKGLLLLVWWKGWFRVVVATVQLRGTSLPTPQDMVGTAIVN